MSKHHTHLAHQNGHDHHGHHGHDSHDHDDLAYHGSLKSYTIGFLLSVILTVIPFWLVMDNVFASSTTTAMVILGFAAVQVVVHMVYFLHMSTKSEGGWNMLSLIFTIVVVIIMLAGSIWVMYHLNHNMMPGMMHDATHQSHGVL